MSDEGEDPPRPKRKIKKVMIVSSASSSDSDDSGPTTSTQKKRLRVLSDDGSDSSSGSWAMGAIRRRRALPGLRDSEGESDSSGWATENSDTPQTSTVPGASITASKSPNKTKAVSGFTSDSSDGNCEKCSICLMKFLNQEVGTPQNCEHIFCLDCITEWSKNMNTCPVDRITFDSIVVRTSAGGRVLRTEAVIVAERRPSVELMITEDATVCEICNSADHEESMLLCDGCDLGFHMQCLTPPLTRIPADQWLCSNCYGVWGSSPIHFPYERPIQAISEDSMPSTSSGSRRGTRARNAPTTSQSRIFNNVASTSARRTTTPRTRKRKHKRRRRKTKKRQSLTAARRTHVLASVRAKLASIRSEGAPPPSRRREGGSNSELALRRASAGITALSLFGSDHQLDYFEEEEQGSEGATTAVAVRPTSSILSAYRQARRKMFTIPSPTHATSAPDLLSDILESQTLLHSKRSVVSVTVDGSVNIKLETHGRKESKVPKLQKKDAPLVDKKDVDLTKSEGTRQAPSYPGQGRGWGGGYRYPREQNHQQNINQGNQGYGGRGGYDDGYGGSQQRGGPQSYDRRDDNNGQFNDYNNRRPHQYPNDDEPWNERNRRFPDQNRGQNNQRNDDRRFSAGPVWRSNRPEGPHRQSFGGFENPLDMRMGHEPPPGPGYSRSNSYPEASRQDKPQPYHPLPQPPTFEFTPTPDVEPEEDERSDEGLIIDTEKYDPTEPTHDDDSGEDDTAIPEPAPTLPDQDRIPSPPPPPTLLAPPLPSPQAPLLPPPLPLDAPSVETILAGIDTRGIDVPADILDSAVRQALEEHRAMLNPGRSRDDEGDCPNFSIYSATSVHIASDSSRVVADKPVERRNSLEDLVQGDGELTPPPLPMDQTDDMFLPESSPLKPSYGPEEKTREQYKAKVSKRCPITTNTRNPIKIKLNTPSLIKRQVSLYDDEDVSQDLGEVAEPAAESQQESTAEAKSAAEKTTDEEKVQSEPEIEDQKSTDDKNDDTDASKDNKEDGTSTPHVSDDDATPKRLDEVPDKTDDKDFDDDRTDEELETIDKEAEEKDKSDSEASSGTRSPRSPGSPGRAAKMTESISETEDERSYTPCLDENKDASLEDKGIEGLDTEMISEEEGNDMFSEGSPPVPGAPPPEEGEILDKRPKQDDTKKKKKKEGKKEKSKSRKRDVAFKKIGKGKDRNYRERDKEKEKRRSPSSSRERRRRKDKRKDLERYDVRTLVTERRRRTKDAFGRDVSPSGSRSPSPLVPPPRRASSSPPIGRRGLSPSPRRARLSPSPRRVRLSPSPRRARSSISPRRGRLSPSPRRPRLSPSPRRPRLSPSPRRARFSPSPLRRRPSPSPRRARISPSPRRRASPSPRRPPSAASIRRSPTPKRRRKRSGSRAKVSRRRRSSSRVRKRRRSASPAASPKPTKAKKKKRARSPTAGSKPKSPRRRSPRRKRVRRRRSSSPAPAPAPVWSPPLALSPRTPPPAEPVPLEERRRRREVERAHRRLRDAAGPSKEVFTSGDNILVSVSFKEQERAEGIGRRSRRKERLRRRRAAEPETAAKPVAIIDLERSPFRELTPSPKNVIVLSDDEAERSPPPSAAPLAPEMPPQGPKTPPDPAGLAPAPAASPPKPAPEVEPRGPLTPPEPPDSPDAYDPYEPTRSASASPAPAAPPPVVEDEGSRPSMTLEAAQKTNLSADEVLDRRPLSPIEKVMALLQSTRDVSPEEPQPRPAGASPGSCPLDLPPAPSAPAPAPSAPSAPAPPAPRVLLPEAPRAPPKLFLAKPSPIKSDPIKPMPQATKISRLPLPAVVAGVRRRSSSPPLGASPYSPGSSDFGDLFEPPPPKRRDAFDALQDRPRGRKARNGKSKRGKRSKTTVDVKLDDDNLKILDELPSSAVEMQVKSKVSNFLKKLNRQERVVEEVKLVLKPHYNKKHVSKEEYKHILRRAVPKICHNKTGEINPMKIQALVEAYVKKFRKRRKLGQ